MTATDTESECWARPGWSARRSSSCSPSATSRPPRCVPFASERSAGKEIEWNGSIARRARPLSEETIQGLDLVLSSAGGSVSAEWAPKLVEAGAVVVDNTSYWRMHDDVPLVVAEVNPDALEGHKGIVANPNCSTMQMVVALKPLHRRGRDRAPGDLHLPGGLRHRQGGDRRAARAVARRCSHGDESAAPRSTRTRSPSTSLRPGRAASPTGDDHTDEERKLINETRKILGDAAIRVSATCVRVPVVTGHSEAVNVETREPLSPSGPASCSPRRPA